MEATNKLRIKLIFFQCYDTINIKPQTSEQKMSTEPEHSFRIRKRSVRSTNIIFNSFLFRPREGRTWRKWSNVFLNFNMQNSTTKFRLFFFSVFVLQKLSVWFKLRLQQKCEWAETPSKQHPTSSLPTRVLLLIRLLWQPTSRKTKGWRFCFQPAFIRLKQQPLNLIVLIFAFQMSASVAR